MIRRIRLFASFLLVVLLVASQAIAVAPRNVILLIGDGMGPEQVKAGRYFKGEALCFEKFRRHSTITTYSADNKVPDSAATATALATGKKVNNGVISMAYPGDHKELKTALEIYKIKGKRTVGLVTTTYITHATPAAFGAHEESRSRTKQIAEDYLTGSKPHVLLGGGGKGMSAGAAEAAGYVVVKDKAGLLGVDTESTKYLCGLFGEGYMPYERDGLKDLPHLSEMTEVALAILDNNKAGFFLMVEGGRIDHASHANDVKRLVPEVLEFDKAVQKCIDWASKRRDTLILVTADHETGGLKVLADKGVGKHPEVSWSSKGHTAASVPVYAWGVNSSRVKGKQDNTDIFLIIMGK